MACGPRVTNLTVGYEIRLRPASQRSAVTIVELLVSVALTLIVVLAIVRVFDLLGGNVSESRSILELSAQLRSAATQLQQDLDRLTVHPDPPLDRKSTGGYLEIVDGIRRDFDNDGDGIINPVDPIVDSFVIYPMNQIEASAAENAVRTTLPFTTEVGGILGDTDDILMGTIRSTTEPFQGRFLGNLVESPLAEVIYWVHPVQGPLGSLPGASELAIVRRQFLILPTNEVQRLLLTHPVYRSIESVEEIQNFLAQNDISVRPEADFDGTTIRLRPNRLADLQIRRNRFAHWPTQLNDLQGIPRESFQITFPDKLNRIYLIPSSDQASLFAQDVMAFDVRVFDPLAPVYRPSVGARYVVTPVDAGYLPVATSQSGSTLPDSFGAYVDLGYNARADNGTRMIPLLASHFSDIPLLQSRLALLPQSSNYAVNTPRVYDTWTKIYERDGVNQNATAGIDEASDRFDNNTDFVVDDPFEQETQPPYPYPLRGIEVLLRLREVSSQQIRQASVVADFVSP